MHVRSKNRSFFQNNSMINTFLGFSKELFFDQIQFLVPPRWILEPTDKAFAQGSDAAVECKADGFPKPVVTWKRATGKLFFLFLPIFLPETFFRGFTRRLQRFQTKQSRNQS